MALQPLSAQELAGSPTLLESFMGQVGRGHKTVAQLLSIYRERCKTLPTREDRHDDLCVERFIDDMASARWREDVVLRIGVFGGRTLVIDGIHRAIAYLACVEAGVSSERLPALLLER